MKLKYYLRGLGVGIICTAILMGIALSGTKKEKLTDTEIIERARLLGMEMAGEASDADSAGSQNPDAQGGEGSKGQEGEPSDGQEGNGSAGQSSDAKAGESQNSKDEKASGSAAQKGEGSAAKDGDDSDSQSQKAGQSTNKAEEEEKASGNQPSSNASKKKGMVEFEITARDHSEQVSKKLFEAGLISDADKFNQYMIDQKMDDDLQTGKYQIPAGATEEEILEMIVRLP